MAKKHYEFDDLDNDWGEYKKSSKKKRNHHREDPTSRKRSLKDYNLEEDYYEQEDEEYRSKAHRW
jgi:hypothetical protein